MLKTIKSIILIVVIGIISSYSLADAACSCPSELLSNLRSVNTNFAWGVELTNTYYFVKTDEINHYFIPKINTAFNYSIPIKNANLSILLNPLVKYRPKNTVNCPLAVAKTGFVWGIWQGFVGFQIEKWQFTFGRQHYKKGLGFIVDMRMDGIMVNRSFGKQNAQLFIGTVANEIGQNGFFCQREILWEQEKRLLCPRQLCNANYGENSLIAISYNRNRWQFTFARQFARLNSFDEYFLNGLVNLPVMPNLSLISELTPRYGLSDSKLYYTIISYLNYRADLLRVKLGGLLSNKEVLLGMAGFGDYMRYGPIDEKVGFLETTLSLISTVDFQVNYYHRFKNQNSNQNNELDLGTIIKKFNRTQIFIFGSIVDLAKTNSVLRINVEIRYVI